MTIATNDTTKIGTAVGLRIANRSAPITPVSTPTPNPAVAQNGRVSMIARCESGIEPVKSPKI